MSVRAAAASAKLLEIARRVPKVELHVHLDGSLSANFVRQKCAELGLQFPVDVRASAAAATATTADATAAAAAASSGDSLDGATEAHAAADEAEVHRRLCRWIFDMKANPEKMRPFLPEFSEQVGMMGLFDWMNNLLQTGESLRSATLDLCRQLRALNVCYAEVRFCPSLHCHRGLSEAEALAAVKEGFDASGLDGGVIVCALRTFDAVHSLRMAKLAAAGGAVGFDVAGYETGSPLTKHAEAIKYAVDTEGLGVTVHAGEWVDQGNEGNLETALELRVDRVGHALELLKNPELMAKYIDAGIHIEANPISNTKWLPDQDMSRHPLRPFYEAGLSVSINSDNYLFSGTPQRWPSNAYTQVVAVTHDMGLGWEDVRKITVDAMNHAFCPPTVRERIQKYINAGFDQVLAPEEAGGYKGAGGAAPIGADAGAVGEGEAATVAHNADEGH